MPELIRRFPKRNPRRHVALAYPMSMVAGARQRQLFAQVETYCMFIGYPRSGHSLIGSLLDAHPDVVIAHEVNVLKLVADGADRRAVIGTLLEAAEAEAMRPLGRRSSGYSYAVPGQWQGQVRRLRVIGSKYGDKTSNRLGKQPEELKLLKERLRTPLRFLHVTRNPFDMIARVASMTQD